MDKQYYIDNHIGLFKNFMPNELIDDYVNYFNKCEQQGAVYPRREDEMLVSDNAIDHTQLAARYTEVQTITTQSGTINLDTSAYSIFRLTSALNGASAKDLKLSTVVFSFLSNAVGTASVATGVARSRPFHNILVITCMFFLCWFE